MAASCNIRPLTHVDIGDVCALAVEFYKELPDARPYNFHPDRVRDVVSRYVGASTIGFVVEHDGRMVGVLLARLAHPPMGFDLVAYEDFFYLKPEYRGRFLFVRLMNKFLSWAVDVGAVATHMKVESGITSERTGKILKHFGFEELGTSYRRYL